MGGLIHDAPARYGLVSRALHWGMAGLFAWQFLGMGLRLLLGRHPVSAFFVGSHTSVGTTLFGLVLLRGAWGLFQARRRPPHGAGWIERAAVAGHGLIYGLMIVVPLLALIRAWGSGRGHAVFGVPLWGPGARDPGLVSAGEYHGELAWFLLLVVAGHAAMAVIHRVLLRDDVLARMAGPLRAR